MVSLSHCGMISLMDNVAEGHDEEILEWQDEFSQMLSVEINKLSTSEVGIMTRSRILSFPRILHDTLLCRRRQCSHSLLPLLHCLQAYQQRQWKQRS